MLEVDIRHSFPAFSLDVAFAAPAGVTALFGRSGSGKTTVVNALAGLLRPQSGRIVADGATLHDDARGVFLPPHRRRVGYVFQDARLFPHLSVRHNLRYGRWFAPRAARGPDMDAVVDMLGIGHLLDRRPGRLSGGEKSRVAIGRALLAAPRLLLMDEPFAALDEARKAELLPYLERLRDAAVAPILYVSHSAAEVARLATTVVLLDEGRVVEAGPAADVLTSLSAATILGVREAGAMLTGVVVRHDADGISEIAISAGALFVPHVAAPVGATVRIRIQAHDVILAPEPPGLISALNVLPATVAAVREGRGPGVIAQLSLGPDRLLARVTRRSAKALGVEEGRRLYAIVKAVAVAPENVAPENVAPAAPFG
ncbi:molybdenum ABC transporter ATP-binding protein [Rubrimonas cliftonensis]|uniref:Molybdate transport system ATP-binding protein n=1 Tax=Rubrimonas cliftonensis TaxID=89524 RepID=A0A1H4FZ73_9RHOB|nr:molybdenum ABC transporter ATP-binding protein [Rubrimonas cliftonensis]SEB02639.1 molybdate transport system ATP-binding protein [Rubrimonas cliftonensis]